MAIGYSRQAVFIDGDIILAEHGNLEFNKLVNVFNNITGHNHDGTTAGGAAVPLLKDPSLAHDLTLTSDGITGTVVLDEALLVSDSEFHIPTQKSVKLYVDTVATGLSVVDTGLQTQIDTFENSNHGHINLPQINGLGVESLQTTNFTAVYGIPYTITATANTVDCTLETLVAGRVYQVTNSLSSTFTVQLLNPVNTITGNVIVPSGTDIIILPGDTLYLVALTTTTLEVL